MFWFLIVKLFLFQLFTRSQDKARAFLASENSGLEEPSSPRGQQGPHGPPRTPGGPQGQVMIYSHSVVSGPTCPSYPWS